MADEPFCHTLLKNPKNSMEVEIASYQMYSAINLSVESERSRLMRWVSEAIVLVN